jgi:thiol-disulfide isomerase/thioredoxin
MRLLLPGLVVVALSGLSCKSGGIPSDARTTVMSFPDLDCADCGEEMARTLIDENGVYKTAFDKQKVELVVVADPKIDAFALAQAKRPESEDWHIVLGAGHGQYLPWEKPPENTDVLQVTTDGVDVPDLAPFLAKGKVTLVDFSAKWCEPCRKMDEHVLELLTKRSDLAYRKLDVGDWDTPLGAHYLVGVNELPYAIVYDKNGNKITAISGLDFDALDAAIERASR